LARLAIAKGFLAEYAKLDKNVQAAVDTAIAAFARHPQPGLHLEKPQHTHDDRIRIMPVDTRWRGVVLAPAAGDTYCLVTVLPQDKANAYATTHRFTVNRTLGVLEVRDEEALSQLQAPVPSVPATPAAGSLFADVTDDDLTSLGVDVQLLPAVRMLTGETDLEALESALPQAQYAALHALAGGMTVAEALAEVSGGRPPARVDPDDLVSAMERTPGQVTFVSGPEELELIFAHPFATWRTFLHPSQREIAYQPTYAGPAQVTGGPGTGKTVTVLHRAAYLAARTELISGQILVTTFAGNLADALQTQLDLLIPDPKRREKIEVLNVDRLAYSIVKQSRGTPVIADERTLRTRWARAAEQAGLTFPPAFLKNEWEQVILAQDLRTEQAYLKCLRTGRGRPLTKAQRSQVWQATKQVTAELAATRESTHMQLADEAEQLLRRAKTPRYRHILVDEAQDLHPSQWRLLRAAVAPGPDDLFIAADPHQRVYDNRVSLASLRISVRGRSRRLSLNYRTTQEILAWAVPLLGTDPVTGLDGEVDSLLGYRSPMRGPRPQRQVSTTRSEEFDFLAERIGSWLSAGIEPHAIGVAARSASLAREAREALKNAGITTVSLNGRGGTQAVRAGTMHAMKGLEFQAVAVIGVEQGLVPEPAAVTPEAEDPAAHVQDLQRERCVLFVACTRARDQLYVSGTGQPSPFLPPREAAPPPGKPMQVDVDLPAFDLGKFFRLLLARRRQDPGLAAESFLAWAAASDRRLRLTELDAPARQFLAEGADAALDLVDRCLDLLDRLTAPNSPDLAGVQLPDRFFEAARQASAAQPHTQPAGIPPRPRLGLDPDGAGVQVILPSVGPRAEGATAWRLTADGDPVTIRSHAPWAGPAEVAPPTVHPLPRPVRAVHVSLAGSDQVAKLDVVMPSDPILFFSEDGRWLPAQLPLPPALLWILRPADRELTTTGELRMITEHPVPPGWSGWHLQLASLEKVTSLTLAGGPAHLVRAHPRPSLLLPEPLPGVTTLDGSPVYAEPPRLLLPAPQSTSPRWHVSIRPATGGSFLVAREITPSGPADIWDGVPRPILGPFDIAVRGPLGHWMRQTIFIAAGLSASFAPSDRPRIVELQAGATTEPVVVTPPPTQEPRDRIPGADPADPAPSPRLARGAEVSSGKLTIHDCVRAEGPGALTAALYLARAPWRAPVIVPVPDDGVVKLPPDVYEAGPLRVLLRVEDPWTVTNWPDWPGRDSFACDAPGVPVGADLEEDALSRFLAGTRDLPMRPYRVERLWRLIYLAADLIAAGAPADLRERCSAVLRDQPRLAMGGLLDAGLDAASSVAGLISTGLATARPVMMDDMRTAERLWDTVPSAAAVLSSRLLAGPAYPDEDPAAVVMEAALAQCGPSLAALLRGEDDPNAQLEAAQVEAAPSEKAVVPQPLLDAHTRAIAARQLFDARATPGLTRAAQDAVSAVSAAERLVAASPYRRAAAQIAARRQPGGQGEWRALPAMSISLALVARIAARGNEPCRSFERAWRPRWTDLARHAPALTSIDLVLAEALIAGAERARFTRPPA
jgi:hypothetical protein